MKIATERQQSATQKPAHPIRVLICDDSVFMRMAVRTLCEAHPMIEVVGEAEDGEDAIAAVKELMPDIITMDISMPGMDGVSATRRILEQHDVPIIILSSISERRSELAAKLMDQGAVDVIWKSASLMDIDIDGIANTILEKILFWAKCPKGGDTGAETSDKLLPNTEKPGSALISIGSGCYDRVPKLFSHLTAESAPVIVFPNAPRSCKDGFVRYLEKFSPVPVHAYPEGEPLANGNVYCVFARNGLALEKNSDGNIEFTPSSNLSENVEQISYYAKKLTELNLHPMTIVLSGSDAQIAQQITGSIALFKSLFIETPDSCIDPSVVNQLSQSELSQQQIHTPDTLAELMRLL